MISNPDKMQAILEEPYILITDKKISAVSDILPLLEKIIQTGKKDLLIIADDFDGEALATIILNKLRGIFNAVAVKAPGFGDRRKDLLQDIAVVCGADVISEELGKKLDSADITMLGSARRIICDKEKTTIVGGKGDKMMIDNRVKQIRVLLEKSDSSFDKEKLQERLAKLSGGVAVIKVGAATETEQKEKKYRIEDAVNATKAAIEEGIVPGGGVALVRAGQEVSKTLKENDLGGQLILKAIESPLKQIASNAGKNGEVVLAEVMKGQGSFGYNAGSDKYEDLVEAGIIDPTKVVRTALQNAVSAASMFLITESVVADLPEEKKEEHNHNHRGF